MNLYKICAPLHNFYRNTKQKLIIDIYVLLFFISHFFFSVHTGIRCEHGNRKVGHDMSRAAINSNTEAGVM